MHRLVVESTKGRIGFIRFNNPVKYNAWSLPMIDHMIYALESAEKDNQVHAVVLTGTGKYYCAGVDLKALLKPMPPKKLVSQIKEQNQKLFETFIKYPKPIFVAVNGHAIGASVTSALLCDGIIANRTASFRTPFNSLGLPAEGCSSYLFPKVLGDQLAKQMLFEDYTMTVTEALESNFIHTISLSAPTLVEPDKILQDAAADMANQYLKTHGKQRKFSEEERDILLAVNERESIELANACVSSPFIRSLERRAFARRNFGTGVLMRCLRWSRPIWSNFL